MSDPQRPPALDDAMRAGSLDALRAPDLPLPPAARELLASFLYLDVTTARRAGITAEETHCDTIYRGMRIAHGQRRGRFVGVEPRRGALIAENPDQFAAMCHYFDQTLAQHVRTWVQTHRLIRTVRRVAGGVFVLGVLAIGGATSGRGLALLEVIASGSFATVLLCGLFDLVGWHTLAWASRS